jgi:hypothetical protein
MQYLARGVDRESPVLSSRRGRLSQNPNGTSRKQRLSMNILELAFRNWIMQIERSPNHGPALSVLRNCRVEANGRVRGDKPQRERIFQGAEDLLGFYTKPVAEEAIGGHREPFEKASMQRL